MNAFRQVLDAYLAGRSELRAVERELTVSLTHEPHMAAAHGAYVEALYRSGRIPGEIYLLLVQAVRACQQSRAAPAAEPPAAAPVGSAPATAGTPSAGVVGSDKTQFRAPKPAAPPQSPAAEEDKTRFRMPRPAARAPEPAAVAAPVPVPAGDSSWAPSTGPQTGSTTGSGRQTGSSTWSDLNRFGGADAPPLVAGSMVKERFVLEEEIGRGGMGIVFKARDLRKEEAQDRNPYVAIKILNEEFKRHPESLKALQRESRKAQNLAHPNVATVYDFDRDGPNVYMVMELLEGEALDRVIKRARDVGLETKEALRITRDICRAMAYAHEQGIVHSDFKPANAFLTLEGVVKVFDFGIARAAKRSGKLAGSVTLFDPSTLGALTPAYASCEMIEGLEPDPRDDVYAIACVAYELLTGRHPFDRMSAVQARDAHLVAKSPTGLSRAQCRALHQGLAFRRADRTPSALEFLNGILPPKRAPTVFIGAGAAAVAVIVIAAVIVPNQIARYREQNRITALATGRAAGIEPILPGLKELSPAERNAVLENPQAKDGMIGYFDEQIRKAAAQNSAERYDFPRAHALANDLRSFYPDSDKVTKISDWLTTRENEEIKTQSDHFDTDLAGGRLIGAQGPKSVETVLAIVHGINPQHPLLRDPRLRGAYAKQIRVALDHSDPTLAQTLVDSGLKLYPNDAALRDLRDETKGLAQSAQRGARMTVLERSLAALPVAGATLATYDAKRSEITELRSIAAQSRVLARVQESVQRSMEREIHALVSAQKYDEAQQFLSQYGDLAAPAFVEGRGEEIIAARLAYQGKQAEVGHQREAAIADIKGRLSALMKTQRPDDAWDAAVKREVQKLSAYLPANDPYFSQVKGAAAASYLDQERALRSAQRLAEAQRMLERAREYAPTLPELPAEDKLLADARVHQAADAKVREQRAQVDALKQKLRDQALANEVSGALASLAQLRGNLPWNDPFTSREAPEAIAGSYLRMASSATSQGRFHDAVDLLDHGREVARDVPSALSDIEKTRQRYLRYLALERTVGSDSLFDPGGLAAVRGELEQLAKLDAKETLTLRGNLARNLAARVRAAEPAHAERLRSAGHDIFAEDSAFAPRPATPASVTVRPTPPPSPAPSVTAAPSNPVQTGSSTLVAVNASQQTAAAVAASPSACTATQAGQGRRQKGICFDTLEGGPGPKLVVIPGLAGGQSFAIGRTEVSNGDYGIYCSQKGCKAPGGPASMPLTSISLTEAQRYLEWLSKTTGAKYRLPTDEEWTHAAGASGSNPDESSINCVVELNGRRLRGIELEKVMSGPQNGWGVYDYVGNVQEWVTTGNSVAARGGAYTDRLAQCTPDMKRVHSGSADGITGFRVLREIR